MSSAQSLLLGRASFEPVCLVLGKQSMAYEFGICSGRSRRPYWSGDNWEREWKSRWRGRGKHSASFFFFFLSNALPKCICCNLAGGGVLCWVFPISSFSPIFHWTHPFYVPHIYTYCILTKRFAHPIFPMQHLTRSRFPKRNTKILRYLNPLLRQYEHTQ